MRQLCKGNVAVVKGAILAGCRSCKLKAKSPPSTWSTALRRPGSAL